MISLRHYTMLTFLVLLTLIDITVNLHIRRQITQQGLYSTDDNVIVLTVDNFKQQVYDRDQAWFVEFYSSWCGYCQRFAPIWKTFANDIKQWQDIVAIGVVDCSNESNEPMCTKFEITRYPTLIYFHEKYKEFEQHLGVTVPIALDPAEDREHLIELLIKDQRYGKGTVFPNLQVYDYSDVANIFNNSIGEPRYAFLIIQNPFDLIGAQLTMDFHKISDVTVRYSYSNNTVLLKSLNVNSGFALVVMERDKNFTTILTDTYSNRTTLKASIEKFLAAKRVDLGKSNKSSSNDTNLDKMPKLKPHLKKSEDIVFLADLENALRLSIKQEVGRKREITGEILVALRNYFKVLLNYFPLDTNGKQILQHIDDYLATVDIVSGQQVWKMIEDAKQYPSKNPFTSTHPWIGCKGSAPHYRGYPCGLWTMFHYLTVNAVDENNNENYTNEVLKAMHGYIKYFFACVDCTEHFQQMGRRRGIFNVVSNDDAVLWLWRAHNEVNQRLAGDQTEDPEHTKIQFPSQDNCPQCYYGDNTWNEIEVLKYLKQIYGQKNLHLGPSTNSVFANVATNTTNAIARIHANFLILAASALAILRMFTLLY